MPKFNIIDIQKRILRKKKRWIRLYALKEIGIFGSYSRGEQTSESDIDILVSFSKPVGIEFINLSLEMEKLFKQKIDIVSQEGIKPAYWNEIYQDIKYV